MLLLELQDGARDMLFAQLRLRRTFDLSALALAENDSISLEQLSIRRAEVHLHWEVVEDIFCLLKMLDGASPFLASYGHLALPPQLLAIESNAAAMRTLAVYEDSAGAVEILRDGKVTKYVFRFDSEWRPADFDQVMDIRLVLDNILTLVRDRNPQERVQLLVLATADAHFELQHIRKVNAWGEWVIQLKDQVGNLSWLSFIISFILNIFLMFVFTYPDAAQKRVAAGGEGATIVENGSAANFDNITDSPWQLEKLQVGASEDGGIIPQMTVLATILLAMYSLEFFVYVCYSLPVTLFKRYGNARVPDFGFFQSRLDVRIGKEDSWDAFEDPATDGIHGSSLSKGPFGMIDGVRQHVCWKGLLLGMTLTQIVLSLVADFVFFDEGSSTNQESPAGLNGSSTKEGARYNTDFVSVVRFWQLSLAGLYILDITLQLLASLPSIRTRTSRPIWMTSASRARGSVSFLEIFDVAIVVAWVALVILTEVNRHLDAQVFIGGRSFTSFFLWPRAPMLHVQMRQVWRAAGSFLESGTVQRGKVLRHQRRGAAHSRGLLRAVARVALLATYTFLDLRFLSLLLYLGSATLGTISLWRSLSDPTAIFTVWVNPLWFCVGLLEITQKLPTLENVFQAILLRISDFIQTLLLGIYFIYLFGLMAFAFMPSVMEAGHGRPCNSLFDCFVWVLEFGLRTGDSGEGMESLDHDSPLLAFYIIFNVAFVLIITFFLFNILFGIIIDAFGQLRSEKEEVSHAMNNMCFICGQERGVFEDPNIHISFEDHVREEHNVWHYVSFMVAISLKNPMDLTGTEHHVVERMKENRIDWFPLNRSITTDKILLDPEEGGDDGEEQGERAPVAGGGKDGAV